MMVVYISSFVCVSTRAFIIFSINFSHCEFVNCVPSMLFLISLYISHFFCLRSYFISSMASSCASGSRE